MSDKLTLEQNFRLDELEIVLKSFLYDIDYLRRFGEDELTDVNSLFDDVFDRIRELN